MLAVVATGLGTDGGAIEFVYESLDRVRRRIGAEDLIAVVEDPVLGRQAFRAGSATDRLDVGASRRDARTTGPARPSRHR